MSNASERPPRNPLSRQTSETIEKGKAVYQVAKTLVDLGFTIAVITEISDSFDFTDNRSAITYRTFLAPRRMWILAAADDPDRLALGIVEWQPHADRNAIATGVYDHGLWPRTSATEIINILRRQDIVSAYNA